MLQNSSNEAPVEDERPKLNWGILILPAWVFGGFIISQLIVIALIKVLELTGVSLELINQTTLNTLFSILIYVITLVLVIGLPWLVHRYKTSKQELGITRLPSWTDIWLAPTGLIIYFLLSAVLILAATQLLPWFNVEQVQDTGFDKLNLRFEYILAFVSLVIIAPLAEETLFRGYLYGKLRKTVPIWAAILVTSILFGAIHGAWNVAIDTFALSVVLCILREMTGNIWASVLLHMLKNGIAYYLLFINPILLTTLGG
ncbi:MAG TPA: CPBP family intramembrane metalloprotease [Candidatus Saccharibacteria bacterium]|nr:CPBP family intramembrane metalloprotease [Candidatus Saccharibacteria bacterium]HRQ98018.1 CPBP family intramembrane metalloprotease [Candidatus Saccharibacteria bacterium]